MKRILVLLFCMTAYHAVQTQAQTQAQTQGQGLRRPYHRRMAYVTDTVMVHDPVMAYERGTYYLLSTGMGLQWATSKDRRSWVVQSTPFIENIPQWTHDSVPGFRNHVWAPDILRWHDRWWLAYSCSTFGKNTSAIGLMTADRLNGQWRDEGCIVASREKRDNWNAIDPAFVVDDNDQLWMAWGSFWDGIQIARVDSSLFTLHSSLQKTIARRHRPGDPDAAENPTSKFAGRNAIEAPFILHHGDYYYLFVSWDYCCRGAKSNYRVAVGRSKHVDGPYVDREGRDMLNGGGTLFIEGDKQEFEAAGHCAAYDLPSGESVFICHGYSIRHDGQSILIQKPITWTADGWPTL
ncbi:MAG: family 43 glycosylhydrolase [Prevotella sp.]|nr:family 43 glycosylhydrolase [Prevotella sp.]